MKFWHDGQKKKPDYSFTQAMRDAPAEYHKLHPKKKGAGDEEEPATS